MSELALEIVGYETCQFAWGGLLDAQPASHAIHLVRSTRRGTPGPTLCGIDRFAKDGPGFSMGGGVSDPQATACDACNEQRAPNLPIGGWFRTVFPRPVLSDTRQEEAQ